MHSGIANGSAGRALEWHSRGQRFDPAYLHLQKLVDSIKIRQWVFIILRFKCFVHILQKLIETISCILKNAYTHDMLMLTNTVLRYILRGIDMDYYTQNMDVSRATIYDVARISGVSPTTVSRVLNNKGYPVSEAARRRVMDAAIQVGYHPKKRIAKKTGISPIVYVVVPSITNPYYLQLAMGVEQVLHKRSDVKMVLFNTNGSQEAEREFAADIAYNSPNCLGAIIASISPTHEHLLQLQYAGLKMVAFDQQIGINCHTVQFHYRGGGHMATTHLINTGRRRIGFISSPLTRFSRREVYAGFCDALKQFGLELDQQYIKIASSETILSDRIYDYNNGVTLTQQLLKEGNLPDGLLCINDVTAMGAMRALQDAKVKVPESVGVVGFDNIFVSQIVTPRLTTIDQCTLEMGSFAANILLDSDNKSDQEIVRIMLEPSLVVRESTIYSKENR